MPAIRSYPSPSNFICWPREHLPRLTSAFASNQNWRRIQDVTYNLISVSYHALQGAETYEQYASDAGGDRDLATFFREVQQQDQQRADRAKQLLATSLQQGGQA